jgi:hypothetical protein
VALYPDLLVKLRAKALTNAQAYAKGKISFEEVLARGTPGTPLKVATPV